MGEASHGRWKIQPFTVTQRAYDQRILMLSLGGTELHMARLEREVPPGSYVCLKRTATPQEIEDAETGDVLDGADLSDLMMPIMSDTPAELEGHRHAIENATGHVLITGLGLGCIVSALLAKPDVRSITVVEIDRDVIALTGPYYEDEPRVNIINADALDYAERHHDRYSDWRFDYAWHDIWTHISSRNLDDDARAEHGISYATMFAAYAPFCREQAAWAYDDAQDARERERRIQEREDAWNNRFLAADRDGRIEILIDRLIRDRMRIVQDGVGMFPDDEPIPDDVKEFFLNQGLAEYAAERVDAFDPDQWRKDCAERSRTDALGRPNEVPEANVAR